MSAVTAAEVEAARAVRRAALAAAMKDAVVHVHEHEHEDDVPAPSPDWRLA